MNNAILIPTICQYGDAFPKGQKTTTRRLTKYSTKLWEMVPYGGERTIKYGILPTKEEPLVLTPDDTCFEYSDDPEKLKALLEELTVSVYFDRKDNYFDNDKEPINVFVVTIERFERKISFEYGSSLNDTWVNRCISLYDVLCSCRLDFYCPLDFEEFCSEYGYDTDSIKAKKLHGRCIKQLAKLQKIFADGDMDCLPS